MLLLQKVFYRRRQSPWFGLRELAIDVLGFSDKLSAGKLKRKVERAAGVLREAGVVAGEPRFERQANNLRVRFTRGPRLANPPPAPVALGSPLLDPLLRIGLDAADAGRLVRRFKAEHVRLWADVTLTAIETRGPDFFRRSPAAYLVDNLKAAARGERTPPDWFLVTRKIEEQGRARQASRPRGTQKSDLALAISPSQDAASLVRSLISPS